MVYDLYNQKIAYFTYLDHHWLFVKKFRSFLANINTNAKKGEVYTLNMFKY